MKEKLALDFALHFPHVYGALHALQARLGLSILPAPVRVRNR